MGKVRLEVDGDQLVRRTGILWNERTNLASVRKIEFVSRDSVTHDEVLIGFHSAGGVHWISEYDENFASTMASLALRFPGIEQFQVLRPSKPFVELRNVLWESHVGKPTSDRTATWRQE